jgi:hypothetical protein
MREICLIYCNISAAEKKGQRGANPSRGCVQTAIHGTFLQSVSHGTPQGPEKGRVGRAYVGQQRAHLFIKRSQRDLLYNEGHEPTAQTPTRAKPQSGTQTGEYGPHAFEPQFQHFLALSHTQRPLMRRSVCSWRQHNTGTGYPTHQKAPPGASQHTACSRPGASSVALGGRGRELRNPSSRRA